MKKPATKGPSTTASKKVNKNYRGWQSDVIVDLIKQYDFPHIALNPGASFRGLHDSLVNYGNNEPAMMVCNHEEIAVQIAHGYAKATGKPMIAIVHNLVGNALQALSLERVVRRSEEASPITTSKWSTSGSAPATCRTSPWPSRSSRTAS